MSNDMNRVKHIEKLYLRQARYELLASLNELYGGDHDKLVEHDYTPGCIAGYDCNGQPVCINNNTFAVLIGLTGEIVALIDDIDTAYEYVTLGLGEAVILRDYQDRRADEIQNELIDLMRNLYPQYFKRI